ncbi:MAG: hypothetical protein A3G81_17225 [Betaproteobacteria bacterium RIFCSPLOWO2_12_FULL_65_14]|nr:MAG: hypothetical protein A3G81_17225 [Betaproteobacteria bacterium RIFCSPLOWO2_12_FULL_65_14]
MRLAKGALFLGIVAPEIILDCTRQLSRTSGGFGFYDFCYALGAPADEAQPLLDAMVNAGYVRDNQAASPRYEPTKEFARLNLATVGNGLTRQQAKALLRRVIGKALEINANSAKYGGIEVSTLAVFGSYLSDAEVLSDLDLGFETRIISEEHHRKAIGEAMSSGRLFSRKGPVDKVPGILACRNKHVSLHSMAELKKLGTQFVVVLENGKPGSALNETPTDPPMAA